MIFQRSVGPLKSVNLQISSTIMYVHTWYVRRYCYLKSVNLQTLAVIPIKNHSLSSERVSIQINAMDSTYYLNTIKRADGICKLLYYPLVINGFLVLVYNCMIVL